MRFSDFIDISGISFAEFARRTDISEGTIRTLYYRRNSKLLLQIAEKIINYTRSVGIEIDFEDLCMDVNDAIFKRQCQEVKNLIPSE